MYQFCLGLVTFQRRYARSRHENGSSSSLFYMGEKEGKGGKVVLGNQYHVGLTASTSGRPFISTRVTLQKRIIRSTGRVINYQGKMWCHKFISPWFNGYFFSALFLYIL
jgi:hypothetical protein